MESVACEGGETVSKSLVSGPNPLPRTSNGMHAHLVFTDQSKNKKQSSLK
jgi:hypothetical protein